ncbi:MAG: hypothetical protein ING71_17280 [Rhodocyclaceae bacterium]|nr:hypothetical protein [Rhodocyclaceae bacterium]
MSVLEPKHGSLVPRVITHRNGQYSECNDQFVDVAGFSATSATSLVDEFFDLNSIAGVGGIAASQASGSLSLVANTTPNAEYLVRSKNAYSGSFRMKASSGLSQRIANNNFAIILADLIGERLSYNIINSTTVDVTIPGNNFTDRMQGQSLNIGGITGAAGVPGRYAIASVTGEVVRFTVSGWPSSGIGTCTIFGRNYVRNLFTGTTLTNVNWDTQRNGWATGDTVATINTTASPGTIIINEMTGREAFLYDKLRATSTTPNVAVRASRDENIPDQDVDLYVFLWVFNGTVAPASNTTWTLGHIAVEIFANNPVYVQGFRSQGAANPVPTSIQNSPTVTANLGTGSLGAGTNAIGDVGVQYRASTTGAASVSPVTSPLVPAGQSVKASVGRVVGYDLHNQAAARRFVKFFNATAVTMGTTSALFEVALDPGQTKTISLPGGIGFATGIMIAVTSGRGLTDNTATGLALGDVTGHVSFA